MKSQNAILSVQAGVGGRDAEDWAMMLLRMYQRFCEKRGWLVKILQQSFGQEGGIKNATYRIKGKDVYERLKNESGAHRLVRQSPFNAKKLRQTSFALVEVLPEIKAPGINLKPQDLKITFYRASGPGGQYVNKTETAVRITHLASGLTVACQSERSQAQNRELALNLLKTKLYLQQQKRQQAALKALRQDFGRAEWGNQIRSYILHPYKMVRDERTGVKSSQPEKVLDGDLEKFLQP